MKKEETMVIMSEKIEFVQIRELHMKRRIFEGSENEQQRTN